MLSHLRSLIPALKSLLVTMAIVTTLPTWTWGVSSRIYGWRLKILKAEMVLLIKIPPHQIIDHPHSRSFSACDGWCSWQCHCHHIRSHYVVPPKPGALPEAQNIVTVISFSGRERQWRSYWYTREPVDQVIFWRKKRLSEHNSVSAMHMHTLINSCQQVCWPGAFIDAGSADPQVCLATSHRVRPHPSPGLSSHAPHGLVWLAIMVWQTCTTADCLFRLCLELRTTVFIDLRAINSRECYLHKMIIYRAIHNTSMFNLQTTLTQ